MYDYDMELTASESIILEELRRLKWGALEIQVQNRKPILITIKEQRQLEAK